ncbi:late competence development ComFB family protein [Dongshaea marina]|uniref:late competence development ComFB family protein n=1 Tax=Dongshaea marina TaxID=2047966 RepID=UPI000D3E98A7|nr:late competence development ComFB family protein [Dongshaea marina]
MKLDVDIHNLYEQLVVQHVHDIELDEIKDPEYLADLCCITLNILTPRYIRDDVDAFSHLSDEDFLMMQAKVAEAVEKARAQLVDDKRQEQRDRD